MAYIYRYQLRDSNLRARINLQEYDDQIESIIASHFEDNLKDKIVGEKYFEFKLYNTVQRGHLQEMGKRLKKSLKIQDKDYGFIRMEQTFYALVYSNTEDYDSNLLHIEFIDSMLIDNQEEYDKRAEAYFESNDLFYESRYNYSRGQIVTNYYIDVLEAYIDKEEMLADFETGEEIACFSVKGYLRKLTREAFETKRNKGHNIIPLEKSFDYANVRTVDASNNKLSLKDSKDAVDCIEIKKVTNQNHKNTKAEIDFRLKLELVEAESVEALTNIKSNKKIEFRVHNAGQALITSLAYKDEDPFLYFDYGAPFGGNLMTKPSVINTPTKEKPTIIISHNHKDHWFRIADDVGAYSCDWFIPDQLVKTQFGHKLAEVIAQGGSVQLIRKSFSFGKNKLIYGCQSKRKPSRIPKHYHSTGLVLRLEVTDVNKNELNILIAGDQKYDYIDNQYLQDMDILVASHHGGCYRWSKKDRVPAPRNSESKVVYSYGKNNTHNHPSKIGCYQIESWINEHHTPEGGDFKIEFYFI